jgi:type IV pilus assembly protein PilQ
MNKKILFVLFLSLLSSLIINKVFAELPIAGSRADVPIDDLFAELLNLEKPVSISMDFKDAGLKDILKVFSIQSGFNFIASQSVQDRRITLYLDNVPLKEAMDKLFIANNLSYQLDERARIITVKDWGTPSLDKITKVYTLKYATVSTSSMKEDLLNYIVSSEETGEGSESSTGKWKTEEVAGITEILKKVLSPEGSIVEDPRTNSLIITDIPSKFPAIEKIIKQLDISVPQVMLEVEMLDVSKDTADKVGLKFGDISSYPSILTMTLTGAARSTAFPLKAFNPSDVAAASEFSPGSLNFAQPYRILLEFIEAQTDTRILARPRILTLNNETAEIKITTDEVVGTKRTTDPNTSEVTVEETRASSFALTEEGVGIFLRVTPQINMDTSEVTMFIYPKVSNTRASTSFSDFRDPEARSTKSVVRVKDGQTIVIGGLIRNERTQTITRLPFLSDIPIIGGLFRHRNKTKDEVRELLVFITPHILDENLSQLAKVKKDYMFEREQTLDSDPARQKLISNFLTDLE